MGDRPSRDHRPPRARAYRRRRSGGPLHSSKSADHDGVCLRALESLSQRAGRRTVRGLRVTEEGATAPRSVLAQATLSSPDHAPSAGDAARLSNRTITSSLKNGSGTGLDEIRNIDFFVFHTSWIAFTASVGCGGAPGRRSWQRYRSPRCPEAQDLWGHYGRLGNDADELLQRLAPFAAE